MKITIEFCMFESDFEQNFTLNCGFSFIGPNLLKKRFPILIQVKWAAPLNSALNSADFHLLDQIFPKSVFPVKSRKIALLRTSIVVTYSTKLFRTVADRRNDILNSLLFLVAETKI